MAAAAAAYMDSVQRLIATDEFPAREAPFDESLFYHFFQNILRVQVRARAVSWPGVTASGVG